MSGEIVSPFNIIIIFIIFIIIYTFLLVCSATNIVLHLQGLISGSAELREQAALGLGELIEVTSEQALKEFVIPITGYVPWNVEDIDCILNLVYIV